MVIWNSTSAQPVYENDWPATVQIPLPEVKNGNLGRFSFGGPTLCGATEPTILSFGLLPWSERLRASLELRHDSFIFNNLVIFNNFIAGEHEVFAAQELNALSWHVDEDGIVARNVDGDGVRQPLSTLVNAGTN